MIFKCCECRKVLTQEEIDCHKPCSRCGTMAFLMDAEVNLSIVKPIEEVEISFKVIK